MEIKVTFDHGTLTISPDPAFVQRGSLVNWSFQANALPSSPLQWIVYFGKGSPFRREGAQFITDTHSVDGQHTGSSGAMSADDPGDYKYGVRVVEALSRQTMADDDPWLIVE